MSSQRNLRQSSYYEVTPLREKLPYGAIVQGLDPEKLGEARLQQDLRDLWIDEGIIVFKGLDGQETHLALSTVFGELIGHPVREVVGQHPLIMDVLYDPADGYIVEVDGEPRGFPLEWHKDLIYMAKLNRAGILRPIEIPSKWGATGFIDQIAAYERLPDDLKDRIAGLTVAYRQNVDPAEQRFGRTRDMKIARMSQVIKSVQDRADDYPVVLHPMVYSQKETGRKVLNISPWFATGILEMPGREGDELLEKLARHLVDENLVYMHDWQMGEMVLWDNWRMLHCAQGAPADEKRWMQRTTIVGDYGLGRLKDGETEIAANRYVNV